MLKLKFIFSFIISLCIVVYLNDVSKNSLIQNELNDASKILKINFDIITAYNTKDAQSINILLKENKKLFEILSMAVNADKKDRDILRNELHKLLLPLYKAMKKKGVQQFQFVLPDTTSFLRMHKPDKYGDYLGDIRYTFLNTNKTHKPTFGFEQGRTAHSFRNVFPLFNNNDRYIGCYEISYTSNSIQNSLINVNKIHSHFLVNKTIFQEKAWPKKYLVQKYKPSVENPAYLFVITKHTNENVLKFSKTSLINPNKKFIQQNMKASKKFIFYQELNDIIRIVVFLPIKNAQKSKTGAYLVSYTDSKHISTILNIYNIINFVLFFSLAIILFLVYKIVLSRESLKEEVKSKTSEIIKKDKSLQEQSKLAAMGEMIGSIAHQWRQPLNSLNINIENLDDDYADGLIDAEFIDNFINKQTKTIQFMSNTIDDFRNFFRVDKIKKEFSVKEAIKSIISIQSAQFKNFNISTELEGEDFILNTIESEFKQTILNIISNSKDAIVKSKNPYGKISIILKNNTITISDNAGGIPPESLSRIFEPYFTTKSQGEGTGIGLYMSKIIIEQNIGGTLIAKNIDNGAEFTITFNKVYS